MPEAKEYIDFLKQIAYTEVWWQLFWQSLDQW